MHPLFRETSSHFILMAAAVVTTVLLVTITDASPRAKLVAVVCCIGSFMAPRLWAYLLQAGLAIVIILYLKARQSVY